MGRRALPKVDPNVDISSRYSVLDDISAPFDPQTLFEQSRPLEIEVGSGKGLFLMTHCRMKRGIAPRSLAKEDDTDVN